MQKDELRDPLKGARDTMNASIGLAQAFCMPVRVWITKFGTAGEMFFGGRLSVIGWLIVPVWPMCLMPCRLQGMYTFWLLTTGLMLANRFRGWQLRRRGYRPHSQFMGVPRLFSWGCWSALVTGIGLMVIGMDKVLGLYLAIAGFCIAVSNGYAGEVQRTMLRRMDDARAEQEWMSQQMRERR